MTKQADLEKEPIVNCLDFLSGMGLTFPGAGNAAVDSPQLSASMETAQLKEASCSKSYPLPRQMNMEISRPHPLVPSWDNSEHPSWFQTPLEGLTEAL